jgi:predicted TIM-barrel fold metal-dependent hydrolase
VKRAVLLFVCLLLFSFTSQVLAQTSQGPYQGPVIDVHEHYELPSGSYKGIWPSESALISQMDQAGIVKMVVFARLDYIDSVKQYPERLIPFHALGSVHADNPQAVELTRRALDAGFVGIGELILRHSEAPLSNVVADNSVVKQIVDLAAQRGVVINAHQEIGTKTHGPERIPEFERILDYNRNVKWIWAHSGYAQPPAITKLMEAHPNLYADLSIRTPSRKGGRGGGMIADETGTIFPEWRALFERFPDRFMIGTDKMSYFPSDFLLTEMAFFRRTLDKLPLDLAEELAYANFQRVSKLGQPTHLVISTDLSSAALGSAVKISGKLSPALKDVTIALLFSCGEETNKRLLKTDDNGGFAETIRVDKVGNWSFVANTPGAIGWIASESNLVKLSVYEVKTQTSVIQFVSVSMPVEASWTSNQISASLVIIAIAAVTTTFWLKLKRKKAC